MITRSPQMNRSVDQCRLCLAQTSCRLHKPGEQSTPELGDLAAATQQYAFAARNNDQLVNARASGHNDRLELRT
jgi:hypothetical protein